MSEITMNEQHVDSSIDENDFLDASRTMVYAATLKPDNPDEYTDFKKVGLIQSYGWQENKEVRRIFEIGSDIPYIIPGRTTGGISLQRVLLSGKDLINALNYGETSINPENFLKSIGSSNKPLMLMFVSTGSKKEKYSRVFANCQITSRQESVGAGQIIIMEQVSITYSHVMDAYIKE